jgi:hypothetical protein
MSSSTYDAPHYDWAENRVQDALTGGDYNSSESWDADPLSSMLGSVDADISSMSARVGAGPAAMPPLYLGPRQVRGPGETFGAISFFTEIPQMETVR